MVKLIGLCTTTNYYEEEVDDIHQEKKREEVDHHIQVMALLRILLQIKMHSPILKN